MAMDLGRFGEGELYEFGIAQRVGVGSGREKRALLSSFFNGDFREHTPSPPLFIRKPDFF